MGSLDVPLLQCSKISKRFGAVQALDAVDFTVYPGEVVGLLGDNGAGKSTLIKIITGYYPPDNGGTIAWDGKPIHALSVKLARQLGINTVYQEKALADNQALWRNIFMGRELTTRLGFLRIKRMRAETDRLMTSTMQFTSSAVDSGMSVRNMSGGERQGVAISRALYFQARLLILDEPTIGLSIQETSKVLDFIRSVRDAGKSCIFIDHNIFHVHPVADRIVILDRGKVAMEFRTDTISLDDLTHHLYYAAGKSQPSKQDA